MKRWYSDNIPETDIEATKKYYALIKNPKWEFNENRQLRLSFELYLENGGRVNTSLRLLKDIKIFLDKVHSIGISSLEGKVIEAYVIEGETRSYLLSIGVNENLI